MKEQEHSNSRDVFCADFWTLLDHSTFATPPADMLVSATVSLTNLEDYKMLSDKHLCMVTFIY